MTGDDEVGVWWWLEVGWHGRRSLVVERRKGAETRSSHDKRHLGTMDRWKKKEINAACCRGHGDLPTETGLRRASGGVMDSWRRVRAASAQWGEGRAHVKKKWFTGKVFSHPPIRIRSPLARLWPPISGRAGAGWGGEGTLKMGATWGCHLGSAHPDSSPGTDRPCPGRPFRGHDPQKMWSEVTGRPGARTGRLSQHVGPGPL